MKAWIENEKIRDIAQGDLFEIYHPDIAKLYTVEVPDDAANGDGWVNGKLVTSSGMTLSYNFSH